MKYKLTTETKVWLGKTLYRIEALIDFGTVKAGEKGGWIEAEKNLSQEDIAWVSGDAQVYGNAQVSGDARVYGDAWVYGDAQVYGDAWVSGNARVSGNAQVYGDALVYGDARVFGNAQVYGDALVYGNAQVTPVNIIGLEYNVTITDEEMMIGYEHHKIDDWRGFDDRRILQMDGKWAAKFWATHGPYLLAICAEHTAKVKEVTK